MLIMRKETGEQSQGAPALGEARKQRESSGKLRKVPTHLPGVSILTSAGGDPDLRRGTIDRLHEAHRDIALVLYPQLQEAQTALAAREKPVRELFDSPEGEGKDYHGMEEEGVFRSTVVPPSEKLIFERELLREGTGEHYSEVVPVERVDIAVDLPTSSGIDPAILAAVLRWTLAYYGVSQEQVDTGVDLKVRLGEINEAVLGELEKSGKVSLPEGTKKVDRGTPKINQPTILKKAE